MLWIPGRRWSELLSSLLASLPINASKPLCSTSGDSGVCVCVCVWCVCARALVCIHTYVYLHTRTHTHTHTYTHIRGNPGGLLSSAVGVAEAFLPQGTTIVETRGRAAAEASATSGPTNIAVRDSQLPAQPAALLSSAEDAREPSGADWRYTTTRYVPNVYLTCT